MAMQPRNVILSAISLAVIVAAVLFYIVIPRLGTQVTQTPAPSPTEQPAQQPQPVADQTTPEQPVETTPQQPEGTELTPSVAAVTTTAETGFDPRAFSATALVIVAGATGLIHFTRLARRPYS